MENFPPHRHGHSPAGASVSGMPGADARVWRFAGTGRSRHELGSSPGCRLQAPSSRRSGWKGCWAVVVHECVGVRASPERQPHTEGNPPLRGRTYLSLCGIRPSANTKCTMGIGVLILPMILPWWVLGYSAPRGIPPNSRR